ncbi:ATP-binding protein [Sphingobium boeckii]|uniref:histidine kinase n=1 Tax=Sphingobium boeckii TaxID=1082345 RepID=A0A7W9AH43_9SPHN|nr:ATP-binding protein [Sphingobium boeckii]MBB5685407.1 signal transduction histidine kinase/CheY-like chemotaxis protein [Sphingobium boeckii]
MGQMAVVDPDDEAEDGLTSGWQRGLGWIAAACVLVALIALIAMLGFSSQQRDDALKWQRHSFEVMVAVRSIEGQMALSEATLGRAVISSEKKTARSFYDEWRRADAMISGLQRLTAADAEQAALVGDLRRVFDERGKALNNAALYLNYGQNVNALSALHAAGLENHVARIKAIFREMVANEQATLTERSGKAQGLMDQANTLTTTLAVLGLLVVIGAIGLGWAAIEAQAQRRRARATADQETLRAEFLEAAVAERTSELRDANASLLAEAAEREHAEAQLRQIQKMEAVGQLTGGIAHDFNNMLAVVVGGLELAKRKIAAKSGDVERHIDNAMEGANRAAALTRRLLAFARAEPLLPQGMCPDALVRGMTDLMDRTLGERIKVEIISPTDPWQIWVDRHQLENAILNLAVNARDAMENDGVLTIRTGNATLAADEIGESVAGDYVRIDVSDTGAGMSQDVLERVFEPFFTTKPIGKGTGLGLSQIFGFVRQSGGEIAIASVEGEGTTVSLFLPRHKAEHAENAGGKSPEASGHAPGVDVAGLVALIVEDDPRVRASTAAAVTELGFTALTADSADAAIALLGEGHSVDIIVTDVLMSGMTGPEMIAQISDDHPEIAVLFVTGYAAEVDDAQAFRGHGVLRKPFTIAILETAMHAALSARPRAPAALAAE